MDGTWAALVDCNRRPGGNVDGAAKRRILQDGNDRVLEIVGADCREWWARNAATDWLLGNMIRKWVDLPVKPRNKRTIVDDIKGILR